SRRTARSGAWDAKDTGERAASGREACVNNPFTGAGPNALIAFGAVPEGITLLLIVVLVLAVTFDYINGFHDTANAIATSVSTRALRPSHAILMSATANFIGALTGTAVAKTIATGLATTPSGADGQIVVAAALVGGIVWDLVTWRLGIPSSSSHALIGGLIGASVAAGGVESLNLPGIYSKVLVPLFASPVIGIVGG